MAKTLRAVTIDQISEKELAPHITSNTELPSLGFVDVLISPWVKFTPTQLLSQCLVCTSHQLHWKGEHKAQDSIHRS